MYVRAPTRRGHPRHLAGLLLVLCACNQGNYLVVRLQAPPGFNQIVTRLQVAAGDLSGADAGPALVPSAPVPTGIPFNDGGVTLLVQAPKGALVSVLVNALGADSSPVLSGASVSPTLLTSEVNTVDIQLATHCAAPGDCDPNAVCQGLLACNDFWQLGFGWCAPAGQSPLANGASCGYLGVCDAGACLGPYCGDGVVELDAGEQCDDGSSSATGNSDTRPNACRTNCLQAHCGDGVQDTGEVCDLGTAVGTGNGWGVGCNATCTLTGKVSTVAGGPTAGLADGYGGNAEFNQPYGITTANDFLYIVDERNAAIRVMDLGFHVVQTAAGGRPGTTSCTPTEGNPPDAGLCQPRAILPFDGGLLISDGATLQLLTLSERLDGGTLTLFAGQPRMSTDANIFDAGPLAQAFYGEPNGLALLGESLFSDAWELGILGVTDLASGALAPVASVPTAEVYGVAVLNGRVYFSAIPNSSQGEIAVYDPAQPSLGAQLLTLTDLAGNPASLDLPNGLCTDGRSLVVCAEGVGVQQIDVDSGVLSLIAGGGQAAELPGVGAAAGFLGPAGCTFAASGDGGLWLYVTDQGGNTIREIQ